MAEVDARQLLAQAKDLYARYARRLGPDEAADLVGEALARGLERPPADGRMAPWLERIARNLLVDRWRRAEVAARALPDAPAPPPTPEDLILASERRRAIRRTLARLPREQRRSILRRYYDAGGAGEISATTLRTRLHRALARFRRLSRGLLSVLPPVRVFHWLTLAANPAALAVFLVAQQTPPPVAAPPTPRAPVSHPVVRHLPAPAPPPPSARPTPPRAQSSAAPSPQHYEFDDDKIEGDLQNPDDIVIIPVSRTRRPSLIEIPDSFVPSIVKSVEDL